MGRTILPDTLSNPSHRTNQSDRSRPRPSTRDSRTVHISKALSRLLRHQAENFGVPITEDGWVRLDHVLAWNGLNGSGRNGVAGQTGRSVTVEDVFAAVEDNEKKRFALRLVRNSSGMDDEGEGKGKVKAEDVGVQRDEIEAQPVATVDQIVGNDVDQPSQVAATTANESLQDHSTPFESNNSNQPPLLQPSIPSRSAEAKIDSETATVIAHYRNTPNNPPPPSHFMIRATQGHSIKTIAADTGLLTAITLSDPSSIPDTCVHGTFYGSWLSILKSGGLKRMGRNHVHFAGGPTLGELGFDGEARKVDDRDDAGVGNGNVNGGDVVRQRKEVISGMRRDAEVLIYVDVKRALTEEKDMTWWRSENGVILTEGCLVDESEGNGDREGTPGLDRTAPTQTVQDQPTSTMEQVVEGTADIQMAPQASDQASNITHDQQQPHDRRNTQKPHAKSKHAQSTSQENKLVPMKYWTVVVDAKGGRGVIWRRGEGVVQELPERLTSKGTPKGRGGGGWGRGRGSGRGKGR